MKSRLWSSFRFVLFSGWMAGLMVGSWGGQVKAAPEAGWLAFGDMRGFIEPCGCDPATDYGGIKRLLTYIQREVAFRPGVQVLSLGNNLDLDVAKDLKNRFIFEGLALLKPSAALVNVTELLRWDFLQSLAKSDPLPLEKGGLVLSNLRPALSQRWVRPYVVTDRYLIIGLTFDPQVRDLVAPWTDDLKQRISRWKSSFQGKRQALLLFSGSDSELETVLASGLFDVAVSSNKNPLGVLPGSGERLDSNRLRRLSSQQVFMVPLGGQGLIRGGSLEGQASINIAGLFQPEPSKIHVQGTLKVGKLPLEGPQERFYWLGPGSVENELSLDIYARYMRQVETTAQSVNAARVKDLAASPFMGADACKTCHPAEYAVYLKTKHAHAMDVLVKKSKEKDPECTVCHSVGVKVKGGFVSLELSPGLAHVQCENCHGPRRDHAVMPSPREKKEETPPATICRTCHDSQHSSGFDYNQYWPKIRHGRGL